VPVIKLPFTGQSYTDRSLAANNQQSVNLYPFISPTSDDPQRIVMYPTPGYSPFLTFNNANDGAIRGALVVNLATDVLYIICGANFYRIDSDGTTHLLGSLNTSVGRCFIVTNTVDITITDSTNGYVYNIGTTAFTTIGTSGGFPVGGVEMITYQDGYYLALLKNSRTVIQSALLDGTTWPALAFDTVTSFPDNATAIFSDGYQLYVFSQHVAEVQQDVGTIPYAFQKTAGVLIQAGCPAKYTICKVGPTLFWLADDAAGSIYVAQLTGFTAKPVSTSPINEVLARYTITNDAFAYTYREADNQFYVITFPSVNGGLGATWAYDVRLQQWHERRVKNPAYPTISNPPSTRDYPEFCVSYRHEHVVGNSNQSLAYMSQDYATEVDQVTALTRIRTCQSASANDYTLFWKELQIDIQAGVGLNPGSLNGLPTSAIEPLATLEVSRDNGYTWVTVGANSMGKMGQYLKRLIFRNLGRARDNWTFRLTISDAVQTYIMGATANVIKGSK